MGYRFGILDLCKIIEDTYSSLFFLSFKNGDIDPTRNSFVKYYMHLIEIKVFDVLTGNKLFLINP